MPLGRPATRLSKLKRKPVSEFAMLERWAARRPTPDRRSAAGARR